MSMSDPIADLLTRMRNAIQAGHPTVDVPASRVKEDICAVLKREGFIADYGLTDAKGVPHCQIRISLKYGADRKPVIQGLRRVSRPSLRTYVKSKEARPVRSGFGVAILTTSKGIMTAKQARQAQVGGEILCEVW